MITDPWYKKLETQYGYDFCVHAGYFEEDRPWTDIYGHSYNATFNLPESTTVIQMSGAFYPFHEGHLSIIKQAIDAVCENDPVLPIGVVVIHVDHKRYRESKGSYDEEQFKKSFELLADFFPYKGFIYKLIFEDDMFLSCSRNFTRLYSELLNKNNNVIFLCGGDRASFALTFKDDGKCIVAGRDSSIEFTKYRSLLESDRCIFINGNEKISSTQIRNK
jgi:nicotinic acid mononucleotide adenylyltransferase